MVGKATMKKRFYDTITQQMRHCFSVSALWIFAYFVLYVHSAYPMVYDNRFIPLFEYWGVQPDGYRTWYAVDYMMATAHSAIGKREQNIGLPEIAGAFDLGQLAAAYDLVYGPETDPLESEFRGLDLPYNVGGKIQAQGVVLSAYQKICDWWYLGGSVAFLRTNTREDFALNRKEVHLVLTPGLEATLDSQMRELFTAIGLENRSAQLGISDIDFFTRFCYCDEYVFKCRRVDMGIRTGIYIPSGQRHILSQPTSIPFGGNGHFGWYLQGDGFFDLKEDLKAGVMMRVIKRFAKTVTERLPVEGEPYIYAPLIGPVSINPGVTLVFSPYIMLEGVRKGLGLAGHYTLVHHSQDEWKNERAQAKPRTKFLGPITLSEWGYDYFTIQIFYDFGKVKTVRSFDPILSLRWDIPAMLYITSNVPKTQRISLGVEWAF